MSGWTPHDLYSAARDKAPKYAEAWRDRILASYSPEADGEGGDEGGYASLSASTPEELGAILTALSRAVVQVNVRIVGTLPMGGTGAEAWAVLEGVVSADQAEIEVRAEFAQGVQDAARKAVRVLQAALAGMVET